MCSKTHFRLALETVVSVRFWAGLLAVPAFLLMTTTPPFSLAATPTAYQFHLFSFGSFAQIVIMCIAGVPSR